MYISPINQSQVRFNNFKSSDKQLVTEPQTEKKVSDKIRKNSMSLVTAAVAVASLGVSIYTIGKAGNKASIEDKINKMKNEVKDSTIKEVKESIISKVNNTIDDISTKVSDALKKATDNEAQIVKNQKWNDGYLESLTRQVSSVEQRPTHINSGLTMDRNWTFADGMRLMQNTDNGGNRKGLPPKVIEKLNTVTTKFISGKDNLGMPTMIATLGLGASVWLPSAESKPEKEGGLGEVPVQMATNYVKEYGLTETYIPRPLMEIPGKSEIKKKDNKWQYRYDNLVMDVDKVAEYETVAYHNGFPSRERVEVFLGIDPNGGYKRLMFRNPNYFNADGLYAGSVTAEEPERYTFFSRALYDFIKLVKDPKSIPYAKFEHPTQFNSIKAPDAMVLNDWHVAPIAGLMRLLAPVEVADKKLSPDVAEQMEKMNLLYIVHNADYQGHEYTHRDDLLNTLFGQYTYDIYANAQTGFKESYIDNGVECQRSIQTLRSPLMIDGNVNMANMAMALATKVKPVSATYAKEMAEQSARGKGLQYIAGRRIQEGTMVGQSNGWDRSVNEVSEANLKGFNANLNKDKLVIFKDKISSLKLTPSNRSKVNKVLATHKGNITLDNFKVIVQSLERLNIPELDLALAELKFTGVLTLRSFQSVTNDLSPKDLKAARKHNKRMLFEHVKSMIEKDKNSDKPLFNIQELGLTDLSNIDPEKLDEIPFFNMGVRFVEQKGVDIVAGAWFEILSKWDELYPGKPRPFVNIGGFDPSANGIYKNMIANAKRRLGAKGNTLVHWDGFVPNNILMAGSDWTMRPSHFEPDGDKWESLYKGTPMVMTRVGGHIDSLQDGVNGFLTRRTVPQIEAEVRSWDLQGRDFGQVVLEEKIKDYVEVLKKALDAFYDGKKQDEMVYNSINGNQSWVIKDKSGKIVSCPSLEHLRDLGFKLEEFPQISEEAYKK